jgi:hypothetical protein
MELGSMASELAAAVDKLIRGRLSHTTDRVRQTEIDPKEGLEDIEQSVDVETVLLQEKTKIENQVSDLKNENSAFERQVAALKAERLEHEKQVAELQKEKLGLQHRFTDIEKENAALGARVKVVEQGKVNLEEKMAGLQQAKDEASKELAKVEGMKCALAKRVVALNSIEKEKLELETRVKAVEQGKFELEKRLAGLQQAKEETLKEKMRLGIHLLELEKEVASLRKENLSVSDEKASTTPKTPAPSKGVQTEPLLSNEVKERDDEVRRQSEKVSTLEQRLHVMAGETAARLATISNSYKTTLLDLKQSIDTQAEAKTNATREAWKQERVKLDKTIAELRQARLDRYKRWEAEDSPEFTKYWRKKHSGWLAPGEEALGRYRTEYQRTSTAIKLAEEYHRDYNALSNEQATWEAEVSYRDTKLTEDIDEITVRSFEAVKSQQLQNLITEVDTEMVNLVLSLPTN